MYGNVAGIMILLSFLNGESFSTRPTLRYSVLMLRTPIAVLITVGHMAQSAIVNNAAGSDCLKMTKPNGSQPNGEIGLSTSITGSKPRRKFPESPTQTPN